MRWIGFTRPPQPFCGPSPSYGSAQEITLPWRTSAEAATTISGSM
ncbi:hypothetical protein ACFQE7_43980 [Nonomuraea ferruginea]